MSVDKAINTAVVSVMMEGYRVDDECINLCKKLLKNEIDIDEYIDLIKHNTGVV